MRALAAEQLALHRARMAEYERQAAELPPGLLAARPLQMGLLYERASTAFWTELLDA